MGKKKHTGRRQRLGSTLLPMGIRPGSGRPKTVNPMPPGTAVKARKLSDILLKFSEPLRNEVAEVFEAQKWAVSIAIVAWNLSLLSIPKRQEVLGIELSKLLNSAESADQDYLRASLMELVTRREMNYPGDRRFVLDYEFLETHDGWHLNVMHVSLPEE